MKPENFFTLLGIAEGFDVNPEILEANYFTLQKQYHPDRLAGRPEAERVQSLQKASDINEAYRTLKNPLKRAEYLLSLHNIDMKEAKPDQQLLMEVMEQREALSETNNLQLKELTVQAEDNRSQYISNLAELFDRQDFDTAQDVVLKLKYTEKFLEEIRVKQRKYNETD